MGKKDQAWKWAIEIKDGPYIKCKCTFCDLVVPSGISRFKHHLVGTHNEVKPCSKVPPEVKDEVKAMLNDKAKKVQEKERQFAETVDLGSHHGRLVSSHDSVSTRVQRGPIDQFFNTPSGSGVTPATVSELAQAARLDIARCFYENCMPFNIARSPAFIGMCHTLGNFGRGLSIPTPYDLSNPLLELEKKNIDQIVNEVKLTWEQTGVSIVSDGWKDIRGRQLINFLVNNPQGTVFLRTIDASEVVKTGQAIFEMLDAVVEEVGERLVVQVVTDNASNYVLAGKMLMEKRPRLYWTPCAAHCIDLMLEKNGDLPKHQSALRKAKKR